MEENENKIVEEEATQPSREEILAMSREENKGGDEMKKNIYKTAAYLAFKVGVLIAIVFCMANLILNKGADTQLPMYSVNFGMMALNSIYIGVKEKKKGLFALAVVLADVGVAIIVMAILMLCGVV